MTWRFRHLPAGRSQAGDRHLTSTRFGTTSSNNTPADEQGGRATRRARPIGLDLRSPHRCRTTPRGDRVHHTEPPRRMDLRGRQGLDTHAPGPTTRRASTSPQPTVTYSSRSTAAASATSTAGTSRARPDHHAPGSSDGASAHRSVTNCPPSTRARGLILRRHRVSPAGSLPGHVVTCARSGAVWTPIGRYGASFRHFDIGDVRCD